MRVREPKGRNEEKVVELVRAKRRNFCKLEHVNRKYVSEGQFQTCTLPM